MFSVAQVSSVQDRINQYGIRHSCECFEGFPAHLPFPTGNGVGVSSLKGLPLDAGVLPSVSLKERHHVRDVMDLRRP